MYVMQRIGPFSASSPAEFSCGDNASFVQVGIEHPRAFLEEEVWNDNDSKQKKIVSLAKERQPIDYVSGVGKTKFSMSLPDGSTYTISAGDILEFDNIMPYLNDGKFIITPNENCGDTSDTIITVAYKLDNE